MNRNIVTVGTLLFGLHGLRCTKAKVNNPYDTPTTYTWSKKELDVFEKELRKNADSLIERLGKQNVELWYQCTLFEAQQAFPALHAAEIDTSGKLQEIGRSCSMDILRDPNSQKGQWSASDKVKMEASFNTNRELVAEQVGEDRVEEWMTCAKNESEATFTSYIDADYNEDTMLEIGAGCYIEILRDPTSELGKWTETDKQSLRDSFNTQRDLLIQNVGEDNVDKWLTCATDASEKTFRSFIDADFDDGIKIANIGQQCYKDILRDPNSQLGAWSENDKQQFIDELKSMETLQEAFSPENLELFAQCAMNKVEALFPSLSDANYDTTNAMEPIGEECTYFALNPGQ